MTGDFNQAPKVTIPKAKGTGDLYTKTLIQGSGATFTSADTQAVLGNYALYELVRRDQQGAGHTPLAAAPSRCSPAIS